ncbi:Ras [Acrasis kona]|uniref:Ras n=1 Tax=Acrasis kona TaxID=1008807 RepID=A0AAW2YT28_9EUKA
MESILFDEDIIGIVISFMGISMSQISTLERRQNMVFVLEKYFQTYNNFKFCLSELQLYYQSITSKLREGYEICLVGINGSGKSSLVIRAAHGGFLEYDPYVEDYFKFNLNVYGNKVRLDVLDMAESGLYSDRIRRIEAMRRSDGIIFCYGCSDRTTFNEISCFLEEYKRIGISKQAVLVECKRDERDTSILKAVSYSEGEKLAARFDVPFVTTSSLYNINVQVPFYFAVGCKPPSYKVFKKLSRGERLDHTEVSHTKQKTCVLC